VAGNLINAESVSTVDLGETMQRSNSFGKLDVRKRELVNPSHLLQKH
jgi:hypothetical protein